MSNGKLQELIKQYLAARQNTDLAKKLLANNQEEEDLLEERIIKEFKRGEIKSKPFGERRITLTHSEYVKVFDEEAVLNELRNRRLASGFTKVKLDTAKFKKFGNELYKETGELLEGSELHTTEFLTVK